MGMRSRIRQAFSHQAAQAEARAAHPGPEVEFIPKGMEDVIERAANAQGKSVPAWIKDLVIQAAKDFQAKTMGRSELAQGVVPTAGPPSLPPRPDSDESDKARKHKRP